MLAGQPNGENFCHFAERFVMSTFSLRDHLTEESQPESPEVLLANKMYSEAAASFANQNNLEKAVASACLCGSHCLLLKLGSQTTSVAVQAQKVIEKRPLDVQDAAVISDVLGIAETEATRQIAEANVFLVAATSKSVYLSTLDRVLAKLVSDSSTLVASLVRSGRLQARIDQVNGTVKFLDSEHAGYATSRRIIFAQIDDLAKQLKVSDECF